MKILYLLKKEPDATGKALMDAHRRDHEVTVVKLWEPVNYDQIVDFIGGHDKVISW